LKTVVITSNTSWYLFNFRKNTILALLKEGYRVIAVAPKDEYSNKLSGLGIDFVHVPMDQGGTNPVKDIKTIGAFIRIYATYKPDIILNFTSKNNIYSTLASSLFSIPCINNIAGLGFLFINESYSSKIARWLYKLSQSRAKKIFFQNEDDRKLFVERNLAPKNLTDRLPGSGVDLERFKVVPKSDDGTVRFLLIARMLYDKGIREYVSAAESIKKKHPNSEFLLLGYLDVDNPSAVSKEVMQQWVSEGAVGYIGVSECVEDEIAKVDCVVLPSYREGVPKTLLEAGAMAKAVVTTDTVGCKDVVDDGVNGFLCKVKDADDLADKIEKIILMSHQERISMGLKSREKVEREFDEKIVIEKYLFAIKEILSAEEAG
jgi:glycosyltransferase involved in cell wall biosynthesis